MRKRKYTSTPQMDEDETESNTPIRAKKRQRVQFQSGVLREKGELFAIKNPFDGPSSTGNLISLMKDVLEVKTTDQQVLILTASGQVYGVKVDQIEAGSLRNKTKITEYLFDGKVIQISTGIQHFAALLEDGTVYIWGSFDEPSYQFKEPDLPFQILTEQHIIQIASGRDHFLALTSSGQIFSMGCGAHGQLGRVSPRSACGTGRFGIMPLFKPARVRIPFRHTVDRIWASENCSYYRDMKTKEIFAFGENSDNELGLDNPKETDLDMIYVPLKSKLARIKDVGPQLMLNTAGELFACPMWDDEGNDWKKVADAKKSVRGIYHGQHHTIVVYKNSRVLRWFRNNSELTAVECGHLDGMDIQDVASLHNWLFLIDAAR